MENIQFWHCSNKRIEFFFCFVLLLFCLKQTTVVACQSRFQLTLICSLAVSEVRNKKQEAQCRCHPCERQVLSTRESNSEGHQGHSGRKNTGRVILFWGEIGRVLGTECWGLDTGNWVLRTEYWGLSAGDWVRERDLSESRGKAVRSGKPWGKETDVATRRKRKEMRSRKQDYRKVRRMWLANMHLKGERRGLEQILVPLFRWWCLKTNPRLLRGSNLIVYWGHRLWPKVLEHSMGEKLKCMARPIALFIFSRTDAVGLSLCDAQTDGWWLQVLTSP